MTPLFVELCAGTAALSLRLAHPTARPPVSRMGSKTGYADAILRVLGLRPGGGAERYLWCEPDPGVRLLLEAYRDAELAQAAAAIIRGWADEEPRALWERLRAEGPPRGAGGYEVARQTVTAGWAFRPGHPESGFRDPYGGFSGSGSTDTITVAGMVARLEALPTLPATIATDARAVDPGPSLPSGTVCYIDPPYVGTTGYAHDLGRAEVVELARRWQAAGALVAISEAEPIAELVADGWHTVDVSGERRGQRRTFSRQQSEWVTLSAPPAWRPAVQGDLFGGVENDD